MPSPVSDLGRHEFIIRRIHSLLGLIPVGGFMIFHLATNASVIDSTPEAIAAGTDVFQHRVDLIHSLGKSTLFVLEWAFIFLPILLHGIVGLIIVSRGKRNLTTYSYVGNIRYTLQRTTGVIAFLFILGHVFQMHGWIKLDPWLELVRPLGGARFDPHTAAVSAGAVIQSSPLVLALYVIGVTACVYHLANGIWTMGITWGVLVGPRAQRVANLPVAAFGIGLAAVGVGALWALWQVDTSAVGTHEHPPAAVVESTDLPSP